MYRGQLFRFCAVGIVNTVIDVSLFTALRLAHVPLVLANMCSTSVALAASLLMNYKYTFKGAIMSSKRVALYILVTLFGLWVLQPICIKGLGVVNSHLHLTHVLIAHFQHAALLNTALPKIGSLVVTLFWNYLWYSKVVFKDREHNRAAKSFEEVL